jgi:hypothetical protein
MSSPIPESGLWIAGKKAVEGGLTPLVAAKGWRIIEASPHLFGSSVMTKAAASKPAHPGAIELNGRLVFVRHELERFKDQLLAWASGLPPPKPKPRPAVVGFVPIEVYAAEQGVSARQIRRRIQGLPRRGDGSASAIGQRGAVNLGNYRREQRT